MTLEQQEQAYHLDPAFMRAMFESIISYLEGCGCTSYEVSSLSGWKIALRSKK